MKLSVPDVLKVVLVDDWEAITKNNQVKKSVKFPLIHGLKCWQLVAPLPRSPTVQELLEQWQDYMLKLDPKPARYTFFLFPHTHSLIHVFPPIAFANPDWCSLRLSLGSHAILIVLSALIFYTALNVLSMLLSAKNTSQVDMLFWDQRRR